MNTESDMYNDQQKTIASFWTTELLCNLYVILSKSTCYIIIVVCTNYLSETKCELKSKQKQRNERKKRKRKKITRKISNKGGAQSTPFKGINIFITKQLSMKNPEVSVIL